MKDKYFITTPIYYPSGNWHIGHCYTTVICDALANFKRMSGYDVFFLTGTDEHGQKMETNAAKANVTPKQLADNLVDEIKQLWKLLGISNNKFIRTTDDYHIEATQKIFKMLYDKGDIYKSEYEGWYCTPCESFWTENQLVDGKCPDCHREVKKEKEESYFFRLSKYQKQLESLYENNPEFLQPVSRVNEMLNNFIRPGLQDIAVSRTTVKWGIPVPFDTRHTIYVWIDALANYLAAVGYTSENTTLFDKYWAPDLQMVGKEIVRFHAIIWPALLMALDLPLPKQIYGHGWLLIDGDKMSKSKGNVADPFMLCENYGVDALRYFLLREVPFGRDGAYSLESFLTRRNNDLCNDLGNLVSRTTAMIAQYFDGVLPAIDTVCDIDNDLIAVAEGAYTKVFEAINHLSAPDALAEIFRIAQRANKYIDETTPWILSKTAEGKKRLATVLYNLSECIRIMAVLLKPFIPSTSQAIFDRLNLGDTPNDFESVKHFGYINHGIVITKSEPLFIRSDIKKELALHSDNLSNIIPPNAINAPASIINNKQNITNTITTQPTNSNQQTTNSNSNDIIKAENENNEITIEDFMKIKFVTAKVLKVEKIEKRDKLLKITLDVGGVERTVVSGIAQYYTTDYLTGKTVVLVKNLKPAKLGSVMSEGMILCVDNDGDVVFVTPEKPVDSGKVVR
ncbi:MAG: methionine--tRNA ligase [Clostridia bacterium]